MVVLLLSSIIVIPAVVEIVHGYFNFVNLFVNLESGNFELIYFPKK
jgi:hypothetical protein